MEEVKEKTVPGLVGAVPPPSEKTNARSPAEHVVATAEPAGHVGLPASCPGNRHVIQGNRNNRSDFSCETDESSSDGLLPTGTHVPSKHRSKANRK